MLTRRNLLHGIAGLSLAATAPMAVADPDTPGAPLPPDPEIFSFSIGTIEAHVIHDGVFSPPTIQPFWAPDAKPAEITRLLENAFAPTDHISVSLNVVVLRQGKDITLMDTGAGTTFGPSAGRTLRGLAKLGIAPGSVKSIVLTHAHGDHIAGLLDAADKPVFPQATVYISDTEAAFWLGANPDLSTMKATKEMTAAFVPTAQKYLRGVGTHLKRVPFGEILPGIALVPTPGHTPGHAAVLVTSGKESYLHIADAVHSFALQFPRPDYTFAFDLVPAQAVATRKQIFANAARDRTLIQTYHLPFPGLGHVRAVGQGYEWVPRPWVS